MDNRPENAGLWSVACYPTGPNALTADSVAPIFLVDYGNDCPGKNVSIRKDSTPDRPNLRAVTMKNAVMSGYISQITGINALKKAAQPNFKSLLLPSDRPRRIPNRANVTPGGAQNIVKSAR